MTSTPLHDLYRRWLDELWGGSPGVAEELVAGDFVGHWPDRDVHGPDELAGVIGHEIAHDHHTPFRELMHQICQTLLHQR